MDNDIIEIFRGGGVYGSKMIDQATADVLNRYLTQYLRLSVESRIDPTFPMGVSKWIKYGKQYGYEQFLKKEIEKHRDEEWLRDIRKASGQTNKEGKLTIQWLLLEIESRRHKRETKHAT